MLWFGQKEAYDIDSLITMQQLFCNASTGCSQLFLEERNVCQPRREHKAAESNAKLCQVLLESEEKLCDGAVRRGRRPFHNARILRAQ